jgi:hypothetical protein
MNQRVVALAGFHDDVSALAAIAAGWTTARDELLPAKGKAAVAAVACFDSDYGLIDEHGFSSQLSDVSFQPSGQFVVGHRSLVKAKFLLAIHLFKHKNAPAMLPEHSVFLMVES